MDNASKILIVRRLRGNARTRTTALLNNSYDLDTVCCRNADYTSSYNSDISDEKSQTSKEDIKIEE